MKKDHSLFYERDVNFQVGDVNLAGTLSIPRKTDKTPAVILLSGYGPCTRDYEEREMKKFRVISSYLANNGIAVLRYDDRGAGDSSKVNWSHFTFNDLSDEVLAAFKLLQSYEEINSNKIGLLGHSLGAAIAPLAASKTEEIAFIVLLGGHGLPGTQTGAITRKNIGQMIGETIEETKKGVKLVERIYQLIQSEEGWENIKTVIYEEMNSMFSNFPDEKQNMFKNYDNYLESTYEGFLLSNGNTPMFKSFLRYNPNSSLSKIKCPALLLFGGMDILHPPDQHMDTMVKALKTCGNKNITVKLFPQVDHEFTTVESRKKKDFTSELLPTISSWIMRYT